jgi:sigma-B regulation protein RsbU (phosphoserine phosphatase)
MMPAKEVGGDLYDFFLIDEYRLGVIIGDVTGKGIASALLMAVSKTLLKATALKGMPPDNVLSEVNNMLVDQSPSNMFVTVFYGVLDLRNGAFEYSNGGHNSPYLISADGKISQLDNIGGILLGTMQNAGYESHILMLKPDDCLFFYTDGVTEAFNKNEEEFLEQRLVDSLQNCHTVSADKLVDKIICNVQSHTNGFGQSDDITCLALKYLKP